MARQVVEGAEDVKRILRALPDASRDEINQVLEESGRQFVPLMVGRAPNRKGKLRSGITARLNRQSMTLRLGVVGPPKQRRDLFYARILDLGRRARDKWVTRRTKNGGRTRRYLMRVRAIAPMKFVTGGYQGVRATMTARLKAIWPRVLQRITGGGT